MKIVFRNDVGGISVIYPTGELPVEEVALKDVPAGVPYRIIADELVPERDARDGWQVDFGTPDGRGLGADAYFRLRGQGDVG